MENSFSQSPLAGCLD